MTHYQYLLLVVAIFWGCVAQDRGTSFSVRHYDATHEHIKITGRVRTQDSVTIYWPATSIKVRFSGTSLRAFLKDEKGQNYFNIVLDGDSTFIFKPDTIKRYYTIIDKLAAGEHTIEIIKRNEWDKGKTWFYGLQVTDGELRPVEKSKRVIEFFGDSITAGYAIDDTTGKDSPDGIFTNAYPTYASLTARHFKADNYYTVKSGIGIMISWFPLTMPELYDRLDPNDASSKWDFSKVTPQVVVINLMQNDSWLVNQTKHESFKNKFGVIPPTGSQIIGAYKSFVTSIRKVYPDAHIICALGSMDATRKGSPWPSYINTAVDQLGDKKMHTLFFPFTNKKGHPQRDDNEKMARQLIDFIESNVRW